MGLAVQGWACCPLTNAKSKTGWNSKGLILDIPRGTALHQDTSYTKSHALGKCWYQV